jgi:hypothetical protein
MLKVIAVLAAGLALGASPGGAKPKAPGFAPKSASVVGADTALTPIPFSRVWTQRAGEIAISRAQARHINLSLDFPKMLRRLSEEDEPIVAYTTVAWADELVRIVCVVDKSRSSLPLLRFRIVLRVTEGSIGSLAPGTTFAETVFRIFFQDGNLVMTSDFQFAPGIVPEVLPTDFTFGEHVVPDSWITFRPGEAIVENTFTSVEPPDGSEPRVHKVVERFTVDGRN